MRIPIFYGENDLTIDDKNRVLVPIDVRKRIDPTEHGNALFVIIGRNRRLWFYPEKYYEHRLSKIEPDLVPSDDRLAFLQLNFAMADRIEPDKTGRLLIPEKMLKRTGTGKDVVLAGVYDHLELHNREEWDKRRDYLLDNGQEIMMKEKQAT